MAGTVNRRFAPGLPVLAGLAWLASVGATALAAQQRADFLFGAPRVALTIKSGIVLPRAGSGGDTESLWDFTRSQLTVATRDLSGTTLGGEVAVRATERLDLTFSLAFNNSSTRSEFRDWVDLDDQPIEQTTRFSTLPLTAGVKLYLRAIAGARWDAWPTCHVPGTPTSGLRADWSGTVSSNGATSWTSKRSTSSGPRSIRRGADRPCTCLAARTFP